ncbi:hypothetical protein QVD17_38763 [Tagetes erecta]|uniref:Uncharacterized protein n=1 Tax=Tagetes erecta TaxID=13708 RepID=A0AAD8JMC7_TARER|nr:hypothetical protein QVD17_38763 [Tagetes erecta]
MDLDRLSERSMISNVVVVTDPSRTVVVADLTIRYMILDRRVCAVVVADPPCAVVVAHPLAVVLIRGIKSSRAMMVVQFVVVVVDLYLDIQQTFWGFELHVDDDSSSEMNTLWLYNLW